MNAKETRSFAQQLLQEVWEPFDSEAVSRFLFQSKEHRGHAYQVTSV